MSQTSMLSVEPIIHYPRVTQVGKTYLMTIDLLTEQESTWQAEGEEYPIYCVAGSDIFNIKSVGDPVILLNRFGGCYGKITFSLTALKEELKGEIRLKIMNAYGVIFKVITLQSQSTKKMTYSQEVKNSFLLRERDKETRVEANKNYNIDTAMKPGVEAIINEVKANKNYNIDTAIKPDVEAVINEFDQHLLNQSQPGLTDSQRAVLAACLLDPRCKYKDMAARNGYTANSLRNAGSKLFSLVQAVLGRRVRKATCGQVVRNWYEQEIALEQDPLFGREADLQQLLHAFQVEGRRLVCLSGPPRIGKTFLVSRLCQQLQTVETFEAPIWCHASTVPTIDDLYQRLTSHLGLAQRSNSLTATAGLMHLLETRKLLLVIEKTEVLHQPESLGARFKPESRSYEQWLRMLLDRHNLRSCVLLVCRVPPQCLLTHHDMLFHYPLQGITAQGAIALLQQQGLRDYPPSQLSQLAQFCGHSPGVLVAAAHKILTLGDRNLAEFLRYPLAIANADDQLWQEAWEDLTEAERQLLGWLLLYPDVAIRWQSDPRNPPAQGARSWQPIIQSLRNRGWIDVDVVGVYRIHTQWLCHVAQHHLAKRLAMALHHEDIQLVGSHPLVFPQAPVWRRQQPWQYVLNPLVDHLAEIHPQSWTIQYRKDKLNAMLARARAQPHQSLPYTVGNLLNMAVALQVPLAELQVQGLAISHADLGMATPQGINLSNCALEQTRLPLPLHGALTAAIAPDGRTVAIGDQDGRLLCWQRHGQSFELYRFAQLPNQDGQVPSVTKLAFGAADTVAIVSGHQVYRWWLGDTQGQPVPVMTVTAPVTSLTCCRDDYVAVGLQDGGIILWSELTDQTLELRRHTGRVQEVVANPEPYSDQLVSRGYGDRILVWNLRDSDSEPWEIRPERHIFFGLTWQYGQPVAAAYVGQERLLRWADGTTQLLPSQQQITLLQFSPDGDYVATRSPEAIEIRAMATLNHSTVIQDRDLIHVIALSNNGQWLLTQGVKRPNQPHTVRVWDVNAKKICWELTAHPPRADPAEPINLSGCQGLTAPEQAYWRSYGAAV